MPQRALRIFKTRAFSRWAGAEHVADSALAHAVQEMRAGLIDARLGGGVLKKRIARVGTGKRGGYRVIVAADLGDRWVFLYGFAKNERDNIDLDELTAIRRLAAVYLAMDDPALRHLLRAGDSWRCSMGNRRLRRDILGTARGLYDLGAIDAQTMREFDALRLPQLKSYRPAEIKRLRLAARASQAVFAAHLNTSVSTVQKWEIGEKKPSGPALKLLNIVERKGLKALA